MALETDRTIDEDEGSLRSRAMRRACICSGTGAALVDQSMLAWSSYFSAFFFVACLLWLSLAPGLVSLLATATSLTVAILLWIVELLSIRFRRVSSGGRHILVSSWMPTVIVYVAILSAVVFTCRSFGHLVMVGSGMSPTLSKGEHLGYYKRLDKQALVAGNPVVYKNSADSQWGEPGWIMTGRILAVPGDSIAIEDGRYLVNGQTKAAVAPTGDHRLAIPVAGVPQSTTVPAGCYFIVQDDPANSLDSQVLSWAREDDMLSTKLWRFSAPGFFQPIR